MAIVTRAIFLENNKYYSQVFLDESLHKTSTSLKPLLIKFDKIDGFMKAHGGELRYFVLSDYGLFDKIYDKIKYLINFYDKIKYLINKKSAVTDSINHNFGKIKIDSYNSLPIEKILTFHNVIIPIKSVGNKNKNNYYYIYRKRFIFKVKSDTQYF